MKKQLKSIIVTYKSPFELHIANGGEKAAGNMSTVKKTDNGRVYISGQKQKYLFFRSLDEINKTEGSPNDTYVSNGNAVFTDIQKNLRADFGGYMIPKGEAYLGKRVAPVSATFCVATAASKTFNDLLVRLNDMDMKGIMPANKEVSEYDEMHGSFHLNVDSLGVKYYDNVDKNMNVGKVYKAFYSEEEKLRRIKMFIKASTCLTGYSNSARNMVSGEPSEVIIAFMPNHSNKISRYYSEHTTDTERDAILKQVIQMGGVVFRGCDNEEVTVYDCVELALAEIENWNIWNDLPVVTEEEFAEETREALKNYETSEDKKNKKELAEKTKKDKKNKEVVDG